MNLFAEQKQTHRLGKTHRSQKGQVVGREGGLRVWHGKVLKLGCGDGCTTMSIIQFILLEKKEKYRCNIPLLYEPRLML